MLFSIFIFYSGVHVLMRKSMQLFGQNMLFMDKVLNSETLKMEDHHSELMPEVTSYTSSASEEESSVVVHCSESSSSSS